MPHSYTSQLIHCVFSTKERQPTITDALQERLFPYIGGIARTNGITLIAAGGVEDHIHLLILLPKTISISKAMQLIKGGSSKWIHDTFPEHRLFEWQEGFGAFSVSIGSKEQVITYINNQREHHSKRDFKSEFISFLDGHGIEYDERYVFN
jgi:putative transposase